MNPWIFVGAAVAAVLAIGGGILAFDALKVIKAVMPTLNAAKAVLYAPLLTRAMLDAQITTPIRSAMFLAQLAQESGELRYFEELASGDAYEGRCKDLGNCMPGDGRKYKGRGPIQLTGRKNYRDAGVALGLPLEEKPELVADPAIGFRTAAWYWKSRGLNALADKGDFIGVTRKINGGLNGLALRQKYYARARQALGL